MAKRKSKCKFCDNYDYPVIVKLPGKIVEVYCGQCGEMIEKYKLTPKKAGGFYKRTIPH